MIHRVEQEWLTWVAHLETMKLPASSAVAGEYKHIPM